MIMKSSIKKRFEVLMAEDFKNAKTVTRNVAFVEPLYDLKGVYTDNLIVFEEKDDDDKNLTIKMNLGRYAKCLLMLGVESIEDCKVEVCRFEEMGAKPIYTPGSPYGCDMEESTAENVEYIVDIVNE